MHTLALRLGKTVRELEEGMSMSELNNWVAYFEIKDEEGRQND